MFNIVLYEPEIPPNTGNIIRLCANTGARLHLIEPLGFGLDDAHLKRAGLDYHEYATLKTYENFENFLTITKPLRLFAFSTRGKKLYTEISYQADDYLLFGPETRGIPAVLLAHQALKEVLRVPMVKKSRSLNLSNTVAVALFEAWRQQKFDFCC